MGKEWQPYLPVPDLPTEPPPDRYPKKRAPELEDGPSNNDKKTARNGSMVINGPDPREDDRFEDKIKDDDDM